MEEFTVRQFTDALNERVGLRFPKPGNATEFVDSTRHSFAVFTFVTGTFLRANMDVSDEAKITLTEAQKHEILERFAAKFAADLATAPEQPQTVHDYMLARIAAEKDPQARQTLINELAAMPDAALLPRKPFQRDAATGRIIDAPPERSSLDHVRNQLEQAWPALSPAKRDEIMAALAKVATAAGVTRDDVAKASMDAIPATNTDRGSYLMRQMAESFVDDPKRFDAMHDAWDAINEDRANAARYLSAPNDLSYNTEYGGVMIKRHNGMPALFNMDDIRRPRSGMLLPDGARDAAGKLIKTGLTGDPVITPAAVPITLASAAIQLDHGNIEDGSTGLESLDAQLRASHAANQAKDAKITLA